ncbi:hypothetical protein HORIV_58050 [Vreelandella olivaria]|uniref:IcmF-related domain-containing protein n=1 Tax=Vreelandella olivaria TaxID=390919 RepID=A0ABM7GRW1_9GAMM|nr:hypothetical protein HORIV_58050 [Halomonas olivaria]
MIDVWVLGQRDNINFSEADKEQLQTALREHYVSDYHVSWRDALRDTQLVPLPDIHQAIVVADALVGHSARLIGYWQPLSAIPVFILNYLLMMSRHAKRCNSPSVTSLR